VPTRSVPTAARAIFTFSLSTFFTASFPQ